MRFTAAVRVEQGTSKDGIAQLWIREDRPAYAEPYLFDNMDDRPITSSEWQVVELGGLVQHDAEDLNMGCMAFGGARVWFDDVKFEIVEEQMAAPAEAE